MLKNCVKTTYRVVKKNSQKKVANNWHFTFYEESTKKYDMFHVFFLGYPLNLELANPRLPPLLYRVGSFPSPTASGRN